MARNIIIFIIVVVFLILFIYAFREGCVIASDRGQKSLETVEVSSKPAEENQEEVKTKGTELEYRLVKGYESVQIGMSTGEVASLMGEADEIAYAYSKDFGNTEVWTYVSKDVVYSIIFKRGKVVRKQKG